ncbi:conserved hypothetical protein [Microcystis aeruginosa PCC 9809]|jgi:hypothetical protein|uniref:Uncharacterized protein n=14 Tax=Microcystis TaxID=1125 RepID=I4HM72_MICAE|nr:conserved hypothetical protein [Microcystis aeruginosa PCC 9809]
MVKMALLDLSDQLSVNRYNPFTELTKKMATRQFRVNLSQKDSEYLKEIAKELDLTESEVIRKGLKLMALYAKTETEEDTQLILQKGNEQRPLLIV